MLVVNVEGTCVCSVSAYRRMLDGATVCDDMPVTVYTALVQLLALLPLQRLYESFRVSDTCEPIVGLSEPAIFEVHMTSEPDGAK